MKEIVDRILKEEEVAEKKIAQAEAEAKDIIAKTRLEAQALVDEMVAKARKSAKQKKDEAERQLLAEKERILIETKKTASQLRKNREADIEKIADDIFSQIITIHE